MIKKQEHDMARSGFIQYHFWFTREDIKVITIKHSELQDEDILVCNQELPRNCYLVVDIANNFLKMMVKPNIR